MKKVIVAMTLGCLLALGAVIPTVAHDAGPCSGDGQDFAAHHVVALAHEQELGAGGHTPGAHQGFSLCLGVHD